MYKSEFTEEKGVALVEISGKITIGEGDVRLRDDIRNLLDQEKKNILLDLGGVSYMDSSGVGELVAALTTVANRGGKLKLLNLTNKIRDLLQVTQLVSVFESFDERDEAIASF